MDSKSKFKTSSLGSFPGRGGYEFAFSGFESSYEENMVRQQEEEVLE